MIKIKNASVSKNRWMYPAIPLSCLLVVSNLATQATPFAPVITSSKLSMAIQQTTFRGKVVDKDGKGIANVTVQVKGTNTATSTSASGSFEIKSQQIEATLMFTSIGYKSIESRAQAGSLLTITLDSESKGLDEVVVVGFGTQKKENVTGSVSSIQMSEVVESRPVTSLSAGLAGQAPGLYVNQGSGRPGSDGGTLRVRGQGTLNNANPLVVMLLLLRFMVRGLPMVLSLLQRKKVNQSSLRLFIIIISQARNHPIPLEWFPTMPITWN